MPVVQLEAKVKINIPQYEYGISYRTLLIAIEKNRDIIEHVVDLLKKESYYSIVRKENITFESLKIVSIF